MTGGRRASVLVALAVVLGTAVAPGAATAAPTPDGPSAAPAITAISSPTGTTLGGQRLVLTVTDAPPGAPTTVRIDGQVRQTEYPRPAPDQLAFTTPAHATGPVPVTVEVAGVTSAPATFTYVVAPRPTVTEVTPDQGGIDGGTTITVTGAGFTGATGVRVGGAGVVGGDATDITVVSDTELTAVTPASAAQGSVAVFVDTAVASSPVDLDAVFTYLARPNVNDIDPAVGDTTGGQEVAISVVATTATGTDIRDIDEVRFGDVPVTILGYRYDGWLLVETPPHPAGTVRVTVHSPMLGWSQATSLDVFTFREPAAPTITSISPTGGPRAGGTRVSIEGSGFLGATGVRFGPGNPARSFHVESDTRIVAITDAAPATVARGLYVHAVVEHPNGDSATGTQALFAYSARPTVSVVYPRTGPLGGGTSVTIHGSGFLGATTVRFGATGAPAAFTVVDDTRIIATTPPSPGPPGTTTLVSVLVTSPVGTSAATFDTTFCYLA